LLAYVERDRMQSRLMPRSFRFLHGNLELFIGGPGAGFGVLHYDIYHLHSFTVQLVGHKDFRLFAPADTRHLYPHPEHPHTSQLPDAFTVETTQFPEFAKATPIDVTLGPGETLCVPSGWWHTTKMSEVAISVAYNTLDAYNWPRFASDYERGHLQRKGVRRWLRSGYLRGIGGLFLARGM
jgi:histone arginine demethylase JMJD6